MAARTKKSPRVGPSKTRLGLTGSLASGKSTVLAEFKRLGWATYSADQMVEEIYRDEGVDKEAQRAMVAKSPQSVKKLEKWLHPRVRKKVRAALKSSQKKAIIEIPLLFENKLDALFDQNIFVFVPKKERKKRAMKRGMSGALFESLDSRQLPALKKRARADFILHNETKAGLKKQVKKLERLIKSL